MPSETYNLVVIGGGSAGLVTAYIAATVKAKVALIERHKMGGDCLNTGCVPSKALIKTARVVAQMRNHRRYGIKSCQFDIDFAEVMDRVHETIKDIEPHDSPERYTKLGVDCISGEAVIIDRHTIQVGDRVLKTKNIVLALGASPLIPPIPGLDQVRPLTSETIWQLRTLPRRLLVLGGGTVGCEMAQAFQRLGSQVIQVEMGPHLLPREDEDIARLIEARFRDEGITLLTNTKAVQVIVQGSEKLLVCQNLAGEQTETLAFDEILVAVGRKPNTAQLNTSQLGIELNPEGTIKVDDYLRASGTNIYACGDCVGPYQFTHTASHQAWYAAVNALFSPFKRFKVDYRVIPWVSFTDPEVAHVGHNEQSAKAAGIPYELSCYDLGDLDRAITDSENYGQVKVLTVPGKDRIIGASIVAAHAGEIITEFVAGMKHGFGLNQILGTIHAYPSFAEANKYAAGVWKKQHAPQLLLKLIGKVHALRR